MSKRTIYIVRHAKAAAGSARLSDAERPLTEEGHAAARRLGRHMAEHRYRPDRVLCSPAERTMQTWAEVSAVLGTEPPVDIQKKLYLAGVGELFTLIQRLPEGCRAPLIIGHNPGLQLLAATLSGTGKSSHLDNLMLKFPTAALAVISVELPLWKDLAPAAGHLDAFISPKEV